MRRRVILVLLAAVAPVLPPVDAAQAGDGVLSARYAACIEASGGGDFRMIDCITVELGAQDAALNANYRAASLGLTGDRAERLRAAQRLWLRYREANCGFYDDPDGGTAARLAANSCLLHMTADRAVELGWFVARN